MDVTRPQDWVLGSRGMIVSKDSGQCSQRSYVIFYGLEAMAPVKYTRREREMRAEPKNEVGSVAFTISYLHELSI